MMKLPSAFLALGLLLAAPSAAQVYVGPRRPGQSSVRYAPHQWSRADLLEGAEFGSTEAGGVRLYFYEAERGVAERAAASVEQAYGELSESFGYTPEHPFSYVLYSTYLDFLQTNLFPVQEGTLGVTSTRNLTIALPYFGDHRRFAEVSKHEMAHEFTIQKVRSFAAANGSSRDPLGVYPLWFIEGLAEFYAHDGLTAESVMLGRDLVANASVRRRWGPLGFFDDAPGSVLWTYRLGHLRCAFLAETYGDDVIQELLERGHEAVGTSFSGHTALRGFPALVTAVTGEAPGQVERLWQEWLREKSYSDWLAAEQRPSDVQPLPRTRGYLLGLSSNPRGDLLAYTAIDEQTWRTRLYVVDPRDPRHPLKVTADGRPGAESLHPVEERTVALADARVAWAVQQRGRDVIQWRDIERELVPYRGRRAEKRAERTEGELPPRRIRLDLADGGSIDLREHGLVGATGLSLSPDGQQLAFVGLTASGRTDVFRTRLDGPIVLERLTDDAYGERHTTFTPEGVVFASDATTGGHYALFRHDGTALEQLTGGSSDHLEPVYSDGHLLFTAWDGERLDLYEHAGDRVLRQTHITTGLSSPGARDDGAWAVLQHGGVRVPVEIPREVWRNEPVARDEPDGPPAPFATRPLDLAAPYRPTDLRNWRVTNGVGYFGAGPGGLYGQLFATASDHLADRAVVLSAAAFGSFRLSDGYIAYVDQSHRLTWAGGIGQQLRFRIDTTLPSLRFQSAERSFGVTASARHPFDRYAYFQVDAQVGGTQYFLLNNTEDVLRSSADPDGDGTLYDRWQQANGKVRPQAELSARLGYDTVRYHPTTGPHGGGSALLEGTIAVQPFHGNTFGSVRLDAERYLPVRVRALFGANLFVRASLGSSHGGTYARSFFLSSFDSLRGVRFGDADWLLGRHFVTSTAELQLPLDALLRIAILSSVEAIVGVDAGAVANDPEDLLDQRVVDLALGTNLVFGPLVFRVHFARPFNTGNGLPPTGPSPWVPNLSLRWLSL